uniref:Uncharacterized protein n=1 Tax=Xenopus tropicalis TaxID=8364 RepID=A0A1B8XSK2_XENTR
MDPVDPNKTTSSPLGNSQQVNTAMNVFQDAIARALGISNPDGAPVGANAGTVTGPSSSANVAGNSSAGPSTRSSGRKRARSPEDQTSSTQVASSPGPSTSMASSSGATPSTSSSGRKRARSKTRIDSTISSSVAKKDNSGQQNQCNVQNNVTSPENPSTTTRGIFEYIELSERERAIQAHQQQMVLQQQMEHLRESPYEDSPLFRNPIPETRKRKLDTNPEDVALWNPKRLRPRLGKGPKVRPKALATKAETRDVQGKEDSTSDDIFPPTSVIMTRLRARAQAMKRKDPSRSEQSDKKDDSQSK